MKNSDLKTKMVSDLMADVRKVAASEITVVQGLTAKIQEIKDLRKEYTGTAETLREKAKEKTPTNLESGKIKSWLENKNQVTRRLQDAEAAIKEIDESFLPAAVDELSTARERLYNIVYAIVSRHKEVYQQKVDSLSFEINAILDAWDDALNLFGSEEIPVPSIDEKAIMKRVADITVAVKKENSAIAAFNTALKTANALSMARAR